jgi:putative glycerol-1-phosphate prenyltransferase
MVHLPLKTNCLAISILDTFRDASDNGRKKLAVLVDPDKLSENQIDTLCDSPYFPGVDYLFVGGSIVADGATKNCIHALRSKTKKPIIIFPGSPNQIDNQADGIFLLSLISGRNPELLIGKHVEAAFKLKDSQIEIIPTGYMLVDGGKMTTVAYVSGTVPIPRNDDDIAAATALAGVQLGLKMIYMDCGSGALHFAPENIISSVKNAIDVPLVVGGGIRTKEDAEKVYAYGADIVVVGNKLEEDPQVLEELVLAKEHFNSSLIRTK